MSGSAPPAARRYRVALGGGSGETVAVATSPEQAARAVFEYPVDVERDGTVKLAGSGMILGRVAPDWRRN